MKSLPVNIDFLKGDVDFAAPMAAGAFMPQMAMASAGGGMPQPSPARGDLKQVGKVRTVFPETWLWTNSSTGYICKTLNHCKAYAKVQLFLLTVPIALTPNTLYC